ncbi:uncharacterized protein ACLA_061820 [Aspergillus clavatus NRRL 1]|uniref:Uncharacterized protein n=1 Tax=Aspergillus clavatus (strain ATCC 1007 / CBS 513.65 / DSM 816 / NCTC 3887 / NRRL 1 / QM 1276 / 107) TaxID=344612 RepID=A1CCG3_ASPCL|nr:uncharacterized protein ACLA_061820 [Aspergillus clavatus NRRL 1]EAW12220.1 hypothetical protein ACLA_061820 [Aspergillus clavatus NRRL 1]
MMPLGMQKQVMASFSQPLLGRQWEEPLWNMRLSSTPYDNLVSVAMVGQGKSPVVSEYSLLTPIAVEWL